MWPFSYFRKRKEEKFQKLEEIRLEKLRKEKEKFRKKKEYIDVFVSNHNKQENEKKDKFLDKLNKEIEKDNSTCPNCKGNNIIQVYRRPKGELKGSLDSFSTSSHSSSLFSSSSSHYSKTNGNIEGQLDTLRVNKCNDCGQEWEIKSKEFLAKYYPDKVDYEDYVYYFLNDCCRKISELNEFNPNDLNEECCSIDEKKQQCIQKIKESWWIDSVKPLTIELIYYYMRINSYSYGPSRRDYLINGYTKDYDIDKYMGSFNPEFEELLINELGFKKHFENE